VAGRQQDKKEEERREERGLVEIDLVP